MTQKMAFFVFFAIVLTIYMLVNYYIFFRGMQAIPPGSALRPAFAWVFWILAAAYVAGRVLENVFLGTVSDILVWTGSFWLGAMFYFFLLVLLFDGIRLLDHYLQVLPQPGGDAMLRLRKFVLLGSVVLVAVLLAAGYINARHPRVHTVHIALTSEYPGELQSVRALGNTTLGGSATPAPPHDDLAKPRR